MFPRAVENIEFHVLQKKEKRICRCVAYELIHSIRYGNVLPKTHVRDGVVNPS